MHEYAIVAALVDQVAAVAAGSGRPDAQVHRVHLSIGELAGVEHELLALAFDAFRTGTICADAVLEVRRVPARWACPRCQTAIAPGQVLRCGPCGRPARLVQGDELVLDRVEMEAPDV